MLRQSTSVQIHWRAGLRLVPLSVLSFAMTVSATLAAGGLDSRVYGAWLEAPSQCSEIFVYSKGTWSFRKPVNPFGPGYIFTKGAVRSSNGSCRLLSATANAEGTRLTLECKTSVAYDRHVARLKMNADDTIDYFFEGNEVMKQNFKRCPRP